MLLLADIVDGVVGVGVGVGVGDEGKKRGSTVMGEKRVKSIVRLARFFYRFNFILP